MIKSIFLSFLVLSLIGTALGILLLLLKPLTRKHLSSIWQYTALTAVAVIMLIPMQLTAANVKDSPPSIDTSPQEVYLVDHTNKLTATEHHTEVALQETDTESTSHRNAPHSTVLVKAVPDKVLGTISLIWLTVCLALLAIRLPLAMHLGYTVKKSSRPVSLPTLSQYTKRRISVRTSDNVTSPFVYGLFRPVLILPSTPLTDNQLDGILRHEAVHIKRCDVLVRWIMLILKCVHFFNPFVYILTRNMETECELSCDLLAVKGMTADGRRTYAETILSLLPTGKHTYSTLSTAMSRSKKILKARLKALVGTKAVGKATLAVSLAVLLSVLSVTFFLGGKINGTLASTLEAQGKNEAVTHSENGALEAFVESPDAPMIEVRTRDSERVMSIPYAVMQAFPASNRDGWSKDDFGTLASVDVYCGDIGDFRWAFVASGPVMSASNLNFCTSHDGGKSWYVNNSLQSIGKGIVENAYFISETEAYITYSGGGYGRGVSRTTDGGKTWKHNMEYGSILPLSEEDALKTLKNQLIIAYVNTYGEYTPRYDDPGSMSGDKARLPYIIENLNITSDDGEYYTVPVIWDFLIEKESGNIFKLYRGLDIMLLPFDPYDSTALAFAG